MPNRKPLLPSLSSSSPSSPSSLPSTSRSTSARMLPPLSSSSGTAGRRIPLYSHTEGDVDEDDEEDDDDFNPIGSRPSSRHRPSPTSNPSGTSSASTLLPSGMPSSLISSTSPSSGPSSGSKLLRSVTYGNDPAPGGSGDDSDGARGGVDESAGGGGRGSMTPGKLRRSASSRSGSTGILRSSITNRTRRGYSGLTNMSAPGLSRPGSFLAHQREMEDPDPDANFFKMDSFNNMDGSDTEGEEEGLIGVGVGALGSVFGSGAVGVSRRNSGKRGLGGGGTGGSSGFRAGSGSGTPNAGSATAAGGTINGSNHSPPNNREPLPSPNSLHGQVGPDHGYIGRMPSASNLNPNRQISDEVLPFAAAPASDEGRERLEWQTMLASVLGGEILKGEKSRIGGERPTSETYKKELGSAFWWQIRAKLRGRSEEEERRRVKERKDRTVDAILEEVERFKVVMPENVAMREVQANIIPGAVRKGEQMGVEGEDGKAEGKEETAEGKTEEDEEVRRAMTADQYAMEQVLEILNKLSLAESLYPHRRAMRMEKALYDSAAFQARVDAMSAWTTNIRLLEMSLQRLQKWTGSLDLDVTKPNTNTEMPLGQSTHHPLDARANARARIDAADDSTFIERILKEDSIVNIFTKRTVSDIYKIVYNIKDTVYDYSHILEEVGLTEVSRTTFHPQMLMLIAFPCRLIIAALKVRLDAVSKLADPSPLAIDDMIDNFRMTLQLACEVKIQYLDIVEPMDDAHRWKIVPCIGEDYDDVVLDALRTFFKLLHWKLKSGSKAIYFRETEVLEDEWEFLYNVAESVEGGDIVVAEHFCSLTNKLMVRVINYFETQLRVPVRADQENTQGSRYENRKPMTEHDSHGKPLERRAMYPEEMLQWFSKILDAVKMRYRKLQRFARRLTQRFDNSAEYDLSDADLEVVLEALEDTDHFLVYTDAFESHGTYIIAEASLRDRPELIRQLLYKSFSTLPSKAATRRRLPDGMLGDDVGVVAEELSSGGSVMGAEEDGAAYLLIFSPRQRFIWPGALLHLELPFIELGIQDNRIRLIADGPVSRLALCKDRFLTGFIDPESGGTFVNFECLVEQQAHLPRIQRELKRIARSGHRLSECIVESVAHVQRALRGSNVSAGHEMVQNWFAFASEHGRKAGLHMDPPTWSRFSRLLMRLAINWVAFICDQCDPSDRKTFRWAVNALEYAMEMTRGNNILHLEPTEFALLRSKVAACMALLISHFDILGARSSMEAKREAERLEALRRLQRIQENLDDEYGVNAEPESPSNMAPEERISRLMGEVYGSAGIDRSIRLVREERLRLLDALESARVGLINDQHLVGQVLDEEVSEDRSLLFLASSASNIALRWQQGGFIGGGANGNVYIGFNLDSGGIMAVKEIRVQDLSNSPALYKQIKDESDVMQMLSHPNIVDYYGIEVHRDRVYIFEEYCEGGSLANLLEHGRIEDEEVIMLYTLQMLHGLEYLHSKGVEHRDVKPDNILLGTNSTIKFVDFGAAKVIIKGHRTMVKTRRMAAGVDGANVNSLAGTPMYMAPEVIKNEKTGRLGAMDIWSMGCVILEFATGRKPWSNLDNEWAIMFHIGIATKHPPLPEPGQLSELGIDFIEQCLTLEPPFRPTAPELLRHPWLSVMQQQLSEHNGTNTGSLASNNTYFSQFTATTSGFTPESGLTPESESIERTPEGDAANGLQGIEDLARAVQAGDPNSREYQGGDVPEMAQSGGVNQANDVDVMEALNHEGYENQYYSISAAALDVVLQRAHEDDFLAEEIRAALSIIENCLNDFGEEHIALSYNGGKDCIILLHLLAACLYRRHAQDTDNEGGQLYPPIPTIYIAAPSPFESLETFIYESARFYNLNLVTQEGNMKDALAAFLECDVGRNAKAILVGTRRTDPHGANLTDRNPTDEGWPQFVRVHPVLDWGYTTVWAFIKALDVPYCQLYDEGYTSLGSTYNTNPNPCLANPETGEYEPAWMLEDDSLERAGRDGGGSQPDSARVSVTEDGAGEPNKNEERDT